MRLHNRNDWQQYTGETALDKHLDPTLLQGLKDMREIIDFLSKLHSYTDAAAAVGFFPKATDNDFAIKEHFARLGAIRLNTNDVDTLNERQQLSPLLKAVNEDKLVRVIKNLHVYLPKDTNHLLICQAEDIAPHVKAHNFNVLLKSLITAAHAQFDKLAEKRAAELENKHLLSIKLPEGIFLKRTTDAAKKDVSEIVERTLIAEFNKAADIALAHEAQALAGDATYVPPSRGSQPDLIDRVCNRVGGMLGRFIPSRPEQQGVPSLTMNFLVTVGNEKDRAFDDRNQIIEALVDKLSGTALTVEICKQLEGNTAPQAEANTYPWLVVKLDN